MIQIEDKTKCCGCSACYSVCPKQCISMVSDNEGFLYPKIDESKCIDCHLCEKVCPELNQAEPKKPIQTLAAINPDEKIRFQSSSGGIFSLIAEKIIRDGGVVFGARFDEEWNVIHDYTDNIEGLKAFRGSKYVQSTIGDNFVKAKKFLDDGRTVLFTGTGCQIAGLKRYLRKDYQKLITVEVICHGVPSPLVWQSYLETISSNRFDIKEVSFRDKTESWKKYNVKFSGGRPISEKAADNKFMKVFLADLALRPSCYQCPAKPLKSGSDIILGDFWGIEKIDPTIDDDKGLSLLLIKTDRGKVILNDLQFFTKEESYNEALKFNPSIERSVNKPPYRDLFMHLVRKYGFSKASERISSTKLRHRIYRKAMFHFLHH